MKLFLRRMLLLFRLRSDRFMEKHFDSDVMSHKTILAIFLPILVDQTLAILVGVVNSAMVSSSGEPDRGAGGT